MKTAIRLRLPKKSKPTKVLAKRAPTNKVDSEYQSGAINVSEGEYELHVTDGNRGAVILLEKEEVPSENGHELVTGQIPAPAIKLLQGDAVLEEAHVEQVVVWSNSDDAEVTYSRDQQLVSVPQNVRELIPVPSDDPEGGEYVQTAQIVVDAKRLLELSQAFASDKVVVTVFGEGEPLRVQPLNGGHDGFIKQAERPRPKSSDEDGEEATEPLIED